MYRRNRRLAPVLALSTVLALAMAACGNDKKETKSTTTLGPQGSDMVSIDMTDYAYTVSGPLTAGGMLKLSNSGKEFHMLGIGKLKPGKTLDQLRDAIMSAMNHEGGPGGSAGGSTTTGGSPTGNGNILEGVGGATSTTSSGGATSTSSRAATSTSSRGGTTTTGARRGATTTTAAPQPSPQQQLLGEFFEGDLGFPGGLVGPGQSVEISAPNLTPGTYGLICFIPTEGEGTPHVAKGMINQLEVVEGTAPPQPNADATYTITPNQAITGPATLTAGRHTLKIDAAPGAQQLEPGLAKLKSGTTISEFREAAEKVFGAETPPPKGVADRLPGQLLYAGFDLNGVTSFYLTADFTPGDYGMDASDTDNPQASHKEFINFKVTGTETSTTGTAGSTSTTR